ncbi:hypothetical protein V9T40_002156 [Parthenolecanium corni]|uniref:Protein THEM6 n=1 Tax=Parthenolecanium corni TaxID=536013 RepID=A0AAN9TK88_9HEMI
MEYCYPDLKLVLIFILILVAYQFTDIHYFVRMGICYLQTFVRGKLGVLDTAELSSVCFTTDIDYLLFHLNNARYLRDLDFARTDFYQRTGLWRKIRDRGGAVYVGASSVRYRRFIELFASYRYTTRIVYWDRTNIYTEHRFITTADHFVRAIVHCQQKVVNCDVEEVIDELLKTSTEDAKLRQKPECPEEIKLWIQSCSVSSSKLRPKS